MTPRVHTYRFGRLHLLGSGENKQKYLYEALAKDVYVAKRQFRYGLFYIEEIVENNQTFAFGRLVKYKPLLEGEIVDEDAGQVVPDGLAMGVVGKSNFFLHYGTFVVAYHPIANRLSDNQFRDMFSRLVQAGHEDFFVQAMVEPISEEFAIREFIEKLQVVERIMIDVHAANPRLSPVWKGVQERLTKLNAYRLQERLEGKEGGLDKESLRDDEVYQGVIMATDGYGRAQVQGQIDGASVSVGTEKSPVEQKALDSEQPSSILKQLLEGFRRIWGRESE